MGRPRKFDEDEALDRALDLFWERGYEATSTQALAEHMGLGQQSLYNTFGDKHALLMRALERYRARVVDPALAALESKDAGVEAIREYFAWMLSAHGTPLGSRACFLVNCTMELALRDVDVYDEAHRHVARIESAFRKALMRSLERGELRTHRSARSLARHLTATAQGMNVMAKAGASKRALRDAIEVALSVLGEARR